MCVSVGVPHITPPPHASSPPPNPQAEAATLHAECSQDLAAAEPIIKQAEAALNSLDKASLGELKSFGSPSEDVVNVVAACMVLCAPAGGMPKDLSWPACKKFMGNVDTFLRTLVRFDKDNVPLANVERVERDYVKQPQFNPDIVRAKSAAAAGLCAWVINICKYFRIYQVCAGCVIFFNIHPLSPSTPLFSPSTPLFSHHPPLSFLISHPFVLDVFHPPHPPPNQHPPNHYRWWPPNELLLRKPTNALKTATASYRVYVVK